MFGYKCPYTSIVVQPAWENAKRMGGTFSTGSGVFLPILPSALFVGRLSQRYGRRTGLSAGFMIGGLGAIGVIIAAIINSIFLLFTSLLIYGAETATNLQARYAGTDLANSKQRATAVSITMVFTIFGAVAGPSLVNVMGNFALSIGVPSLAGPFILAATAYILAGVVLFIMLRPDPLVIANTIEVINQEPSDKGHLTTTVHTETENNRSIIIGAMIMVLTQIVMHDNDTSSYETSWT